MEEYTNNAELEPIMRRITGTREQKVFMMRRSQAQIERALTGRMIDAWMEIERAFRIIAGHMGYGGGDLTRVKGFDELQHQEWQQQQIDKYREWAKACPDKCRGVVIDLAHFGFGVDEIAFQRSIDKKTVILRFREGLNEYCIQRGWGDQIEK